MCKLVTGKTLVHLLLSKRRGYQPQAEILADQGQHLQLVYTDQQQSCNERFYGN